MVTGLRGEPGLIAAKHVTKEAEVVSGLVRIRPLGVVESIVLESLPSMNLVATVLVQEVRRVS